MTTAERPDDFLTQVEYVCRLRLPAGALLERRTLGTPPFNYLHIAVQQHGFTSLFPLAASAHGVDEALLARFLALHRRYRSTDSAVCSELIYDGPPVPPHLSRHAQECGVRLTRFTDYQNLIDFQPYLAAQQTWLDNEPGYAHHQYIAQRLRYRQDDAITTTEDAAALLHDWYKTDHGCFLLALGDFGAGKSFLLRALARRLAADPDAPTPVLIPLHGLEKLHSLDGLVAAHLAQHGMERLYPKAFRYMLEQGRIVLLLDGFDELALSVTYARATEHLRTLTAAASGAAKLIVTSRSQYFESDAQVEAALGVAADPTFSRRIVHIERFDTQRIRRYLGHVLPDPTQARIRYQLIARVGDLTGLATNPRMLSFIAELPLADLQRALRREQGLTAADLYRLLLNRWLSREHERVRPADATPGLSRRDLWTTIIYLARLLWRRTEPTLAVAELTEELGRILQTLAAPPLNPAQAAHEVGSGSLLVSDGQGRLGFIHYSVLEWLVAYRTASELRAGRTPSTLTLKPISTLLADFLCDLAGRDVALAWAQTALAEQPGEQAKANALLLLEQLNVQTQSHLQLIGVDLRGRDLSERTLASGDFTGADLSAARLVNSDLRHARLAGARLFGTDLRQAQLQNTDLSDADLSHARLLGADLRGAGLTGTLLVRAQLVGARLDEQALANTDTYGYAPPLPTAVHSFVANGAAGTALAWSPDGQWLASGHSDGSLRLWDWTGRHELCRWYGDYTAVRTLVFAPDSRQIAAGYADGTLALWPLTAAAPLFTRRGPASGGGVAFTRDGGQIVCGYSDGSVHWWARESGAAVATAAPTAAVADLAVAADGRLAAATARGLRLWQADGSPLPGWIAPPERLQRLAFNSDGSRLLSVAGHNLTLWDAHDGRPLARWRGHDGSISAVALSPDGQMLASAGSDGTLRLWSAEGREHTVCREHSGNVSGIAFSPDGKLIAALDAHGTLRVRTPQGLELARLQGYAAAASGVAFGPHGDWLAVSSADGWLRLWHPANGRKLRRLAGHNGALTALAASPDGRQLAVATAAGPVRVWSPEGRERFQTGHHGEPAQALAFSTDSRRLAILTSDGMLRIWDTTTTTAIAVWHDSSEIRHIAFGPQDLLYSAAADGVLRARTLSGEEQLHWENNCPLTALAVAADGQLAVGAANGALHLWSKDGQLRTLQPGPSGPITALAFRPDGHGLAGGVADRTVRLWDTDTGAQQACLAGHEGLVTALAFGPRGHRLASAAVDNTVRLWDQKHCLATLAPLPQGWVAYTPSGRYRIGGELAGGFWHTVGLCRFEPGELDPYLEKPLRLGEDERLVMGGF